MAHRTSKRVAALVASALLVSAVQAQVSPSGPAGYSRAAAAARQNCTQTPGVAYRPCPPPPQQPPARAETDDNGNALWWLLPIGAAVGAAVLSGNDSRKLGRFDSERLLDEKGPQLSTMAHPGAFEVEGYIQSGWPLVFNVDAPADASVYLKLIVDGVDPDLLPTYGLARPQQAQAVRSRRRNAPPPKPIEVAANGWYARVDLPDLPQLAQPRRAWLQLTSVQNGQPRPLSVYAVGAGPKAVGSTALTVDRFGPSPLSRKGDPRAANYLVTFHNQALFPRLVARISQQRAVEQGGYRRKFVGGDIDLVQMRQPAWAPTISGTWPGPGARLPGKGLYDMNVVMFTPHGDWVLGVSPTPVTIQ